MVTILPKSEIIRWLKAFKADEKRGIHWGTFCEKVCLLSTSGIEHMMTGVGMEPESQAKLSRAIADWRGGWIKVMQGQRQRQWIVYRQKAEPMYVKRIEFDARTLKVRPCIINRRDY